MTQGRSCFGSTVGVYSDKRIVWWGVLLRVTDWNMLLCLMPRSMWLPKAMVSNVKSSYRVNDWLPRETTARVHSLWYTIRSIRSAGSYLCLPMYYTGWGSLSLFEQCCLICVYKGVHTVCAGAVCVFTCLLGLRAEVGLQKVTHNCVYTNILWTSVF